LPASTTTAAHDPFPHLLRTVYCACAFCLGCYAVWFALRLRAYAGLPVHTARIAQHRAGCRTALPFVTAFATTRSAVGCGLPAFPPAAHAIPRLLVLRFGLPVATPGSYTRLTHTGYCYLCARFALPRFPAHAVRFIYAVLFAPACSATTPHCQFTACPHRHCSTLRRTDMYTACTPLTRHALRTTAVAHARVLPYYRAQFAHCAHCGSGSLVFGRRLLARAPLPVLRTHPLPTPACYRITRIFPPCTCRTIPALPIVLQLLPSAHAFARARCGLAGRTRRLAHLRALRYRVLCRYHGLVWFRACCCYGTRAHHSGFRAPTHAPRTRSRVVRFPFALTWFVSRTVWFAVLRVYML